MKHGDQESVSACLWCRCSFACDCMLNAERSVCLAVALSHGPVEALRAVLAWLWHLAMGQCVCSSLPIAGVYPGAGYWMLFPPLVSAAKW